MTTKKKRARQDARHGARSRKVLPARATEPQADLRAVDWRKLEPAIAEMLVEMLAVAVQLAVAESELQRSRHSGE